MPDDRSAPDLIRSVGLMADGPVPWGRPVRHSAPGVFVVELPAPLPSAPLDLALIVGLGAPFQGPFQASVEPVERLHDEMAAGQYLPWIESSNQ